jgi:hypothetical protein
MDGFGVALASSATAAAYLLGVSWAMGGSGPLLSTLVAVDVELDEQVIGVFFSGDVSFLALKDVGNGWQRLVGGGRCGHLLCPS